MLLFRVQGVIIYGTRCYYLGDRVLLYMIEGVFLFMVQDVIFCVKGIK